MSKQQCLGHFVIYKQIGITFVNDTTKELK